MSKIFLILMITTLLMADIGTIIVVKGDAVVQREAKELVAYHPMPLAEHDVVETRNGRLQMQFIDKTVISLGRNSRFRIQEYFYEKDNPKVHASFEIEHGFVKAITGTIGKIMPELFTMHTRSTTITPHGTIWSIDVNDDREAYKVIEGSITLVFNDGEKRTVVLHAGEAMELHHDAKDAKKIAKSMKTDIHHNDFEQTVEQEQALIAEEKRLNHIGLSDKEPTVEEPTVEEPTVEEPTIEEPTVEEPTVEEPTVEEPTVEEPTVEEPTVEEPTVEEPTVEDPLDDGNNGHGNDPDKYDPSNPANNKKL